MFGVMRDKAVAEMTAICSLWPDRIILTAPANSRAMPPENIPARGMRSSRTALRRRWTRAQPGRGRGHLRHRIAVRGG